MCIEERSLVRIWWTVFLQTAWLLLTAGVGAGAYYAGQQNLLSGSGIKIPTPSVSPRTKPCSKRFALCEFDLPKKIHHLQKFSASQYFLVRLDKKLLLWEAFCGFLDRQSKEWKCSDMPQSLNSRSCVTWSRMLLPLNQIRKSLMQGRYNHSNLYQYILNVALLTWPW